MKDMQEAFDDWIEKNKAWNNEGSRGVNNLEKLCTALGYDKNGAYLNASSILNFLSDNPGAIEAIHNFVTDQNHSDWIEYLSPEEDEE